jgi:hypothetical protein
MFRLLSSSVSQSVFRRIWQSQSIHQSIINQSVSTKRKKNAGVKCTRPNGLFKHYEPTEQRNSLATVRDYLFICLHVDRVNFWLPNSCCFGPCRGLLQAITVTAFETPLYSQCLHHPRSTRLQSQMPSAKHNLVLYGEPIALVKVSMAGHWESRPFRCVLVDPSGWYG